MKTEQQEEVLGTIEDLGLKIEKGNVEVGETYPIFGMITAIEDQGNGDVLVEINHNIKAQMYISKEDRLNVLKSRAFESGIFVSKVIAKEPELLVECQAVVFGKSQAYNA
jgi:hypothetical protein